MAFETEQIRQEEFSAAIQNSYAEYGVSSNARAIPDARDGLKPVQRRILWFMHRMGWNASHETVKSAEVVGTVMGQAHPHGDAAIYEAAVRLAQDFSLRYPVIDGQGNFGSDDDDPAASMRYTEMRLSPLGELLLRDIGKETVPLVPTYKQDPKVVEPYYLPARVPPAVNGQDGVGLGFATRVPSHNLREMLNACIALLDQPQMGVLELMRYVQGPDFPSGGTLLGEEGIREYLATGRGRIVHRGTVKLEEDQRGKRLIVTEVPFVGRASVKTSIAKAFNDGKLPGLVFEGHIPDESSEQNGTRIVLPLRKDVTPAEVLATLYQHTTLQTSFPVQMTFLFGAENEPARTPRTVGMVELLRRYNEHQLNVLRRRSEFDLARARERLHLVEGLIIGAVHADEPVAEVRAAIESKPVLVALTADGGLKAMPPNTYSGKTNAGTVRGDDRLLGVQRAQTTDYLLCQLSTGRVASVRVARLPETTRAARAELPRSFISLDPGERVVGVVPVSAFSEEVYLVVFTREGRVKKTPLSEYLRVEEKPTTDVRLL